MQKCKTCGKQLESDEIDFCKDCFSFHDFKYSSNKRKEIRKAYSNWKNSRPKVIDLFAGCGGFSLGLEKAGFEIIGFIENWKPAIETYRLNHPNAKHIGKDIRKIDLSNLKKYENEVDLIIGGPPCQGFSLCGKRDINDSRNNLFKEYLKVVKIINPNFILLENVLGISTMRYSKDKLVLNEIINSLIKLGYSVTYKILDATDYYVPQRRKRLIILGTKMNVFPKYGGKKLSVWESIKDLPEFNSDLNGHEVSNMTKETLDKIKKLKFGEKMSKNFNFSRQRLPPNKPSKTVTTVPNFIHPYYNRFLTPRELARLQSFPDDFLFTGSRTAMIRQIGNAVPPLMAEVIGNSLRRAF
ncbi:DNA cytosine methyltransferase [archaeon]|mgnify:FL=1|jgi:DNA (cytosine-5)-methyltransferase 1|nr:DNA cytosine methyltransferase [archaeon]MBT3451305.1 DNA cytosine methyltransferase [archaeon]MBT6869293.1 DNA cytosine methyltransferase [archaeon]MBT7381197.1 DNA cytosine methyltransferase [archaeon]MBT7508554.1 DNA cytosine methyltransferase [archaeon]